MRVSCSSVFPVIGIGLFTTLLYWPGLHGGFFFDDFTNILESDELKMKELSWGALEAAWGSGQAGPLGRPISLLSFALNHYFSGLDPFAFKLTNLIIHGLNAFLVYSLVRLIGRAIDHGASADQNRLPAMLLALLWAVHPIQLTSVLYVVQRMTSLSSTFILVGLVLHIWARQTRPQNKQTYLALAAAWFLALPLSLLSKETGILFVGYIFAYEFIIRRRFESRYDRPAILFLSFVALASVLLLSYLLFFSTWLWSGYHGRPFTLSERLLTETRILFEYIGLVFLPALPNFALYHDDINISTGLLEPVSTLFSVQGLAGLLIIAFCQRLKRPLLALAIIWFLIGHSLESTVIPLELMHEHRNYLPSLSFVFVLMHLARSPLFISGKRPILVGLAGCALLGYYSVLTYLRSDMYGDDIRRTQLEAQYHEGSARSQYDAAALLVNMYHKNPSPALLPLANKHFEQANLADPTFKLALLGMLQLDCLSGSEPRQQVYEELERRLKVGVVAVQERSAMGGIAGAQNAGTLCLTRNQVDSLFASILSNPLARNSDKVRILNRYAMYLWLGQKDYNAAMKALNDAFHYGDRDPVNRLNAIQLSRVLGDKEGVLKGLAHFEGRELDKINRDRLLEIKKELIKDGVLEN